MVSHPLHAAFHLPHRIEVFVKLLLIVLAEIPPNAGGILQHEIKQAAAALEPTRLTRRVGIARAEHYYRDWFRPGWQAIRSGLTELQQRWPQGRLVLEGAGSPVEVNL